MSRSHTDWSSVPFCSSVSASFGNGSAQGRQCAIVVSSAAHVGRPKRTQANTTGWNGKSGIWEHWRRSTWQPAEHQHAPCPRHAEGFLFASPTKLQLNNKNKRNRTISIALTNKIYPLYKTGYHRQVVKYPRTKLQRKIPIKEKKTQQLRRNLSKPCSGSQNPNTSALKRSKSEQRNLSS